MTVQLTTLLGLNGANGAYPEGGLIADSAGDLFGTTVGGNVFGAVFELVNQGGGAYTQSTLYSFTGGADGSHPRAGLIADAAGTSSARHNTHHTRTGDR